jgi:hypothetical protein
MGDSTICQKTPALAILRFPELRAKMLAGDLVVFGDVAAPLQLFVCFFQ